MEVIDENNVDMTTLLCICVTKVSVYSHSQKLFLDPTNESIISQSRFMSPGLGNYGSNSSKFSPAKSCPKMMNLIKS
jgi:hypothetical protein